MTDFWACDECAVEVSTEDHERCGFLHLLFFLEWEKSSSHSENIQVMNPNLN